MSSVSYGNATLGFTGNVKGKSGVKRNIDGAAQPVIRLRSVLIGICVLTVCIAGPLVLVWTQSYINQVSLRLESKTEAFAVVNQEITALSLERGRLLATARIERIAKSRGLEYPASGQIEVWEVRVPQSGEGGLFAYLKQTFLGGDKSGDPL